MFHNKTALKLQWKQKHCEVGRRAEARHSEEEERQLSGEMKWWTRAGVEEKRCRDQHRSDEGRSGGEKRGERAQYWRPILSYSTAGWRCSIIKYFTLNNPNIHELKLTNSIYKKFPPNFPLSLSICVKSFIISSDDLRLISSATLYYWIKAKHWAFLDITSQTVLFCYSLHFSVHIYPNIRFKSTLNFQF